MKVVIFITVYVSGAIVAYGMMRAFYNKDPIFEGESSENDEILCKIVSLCSWFGVVAILMLTNGKHGFKFK